MFNRIKSAGIAVAMMSSICIFAIPAQACQVTTYDSSTKKLETAAETNDTSEVAINQMLEEKRAAEEAEKERLRQEEEARLEAERVAAEEAAAQEAAAQEAAAQEAIEVSQQVAQTEADSSSYESSANGVLTKSGGVNYFNGQKETYYSQRVLPGGGLDIPGRHVASDGTIRDENDYIVVASDRQSKGETGTCSLGEYKVYDTGVGHDGIDIYTDW
ncbi:MAG: hypothetical protein ACRC3H_17320 [Lachnospiraceae bacterium]